MAGVLWGRVAWAPRPRRLRRRELATVAGRMSRSWAEVPMQTEGSAHPRAYARWLDGQQLDLELEEAHATAETNHHQRKNAVCREEHEQDGLKHRDAPSRADTFEAIRGLSAPSTSRIGSIEIGTQTLLGDACPSFGRENVSIGEKRASRQKPRDVRLTAPNEARKGLLPSGEADRFSECANRVEPLCMRQHAQMHMREVIRSQHAKPGRARYAHGYTELCR